MSSFLDTINYFKIKYDIFNLLNELHDFVTNYDLNKIK